MYPETEDSTSENRAEIVTHFNGRKPRLVNVLHLAEFAPSLLIFPQLKIPKPRGRPTKGAHNVKFINHEMQL